MKSNLEIAASWAQVIVALLMVIITLHFSCQSKKLTKANNELVLLQHEWQAKTREFQIQPKLDIADVNIDPSFKNLIIRLRNSGNGTALGLRLLVEYENHFGPIIHLFHPTARSAAGNLPGRQQLTYAIGLSGGFDYLQPSQEAEAMTAVSQYLPEKYERMSVEQRSKFVIGKDFNFYISYFDNDDNEYLAVSRLPIAGGKAALMMVTVNVDELLDTLKVFGNKVETFDTKIFRTNIRDFGYFKDFKKKRSSKDSKPIKTGE